MSFNQRVSAFCDLELEQCDTRIQELFSKAAFDAVLEANMDNVKAYISDHNKEKLQRLISVKFEKEWPENVEDNPEAVVQHILHSSIFSQCIDFGCKHSFCYLFSIQSPSAYKHVYVQFSVN